MKGGKVIKNKYSKMTHSELLKVLSTATPGKEARLIHHELKKYGDGVFFWDRYPGLIQAGVIIFDILVSVAGVLAILKCLGVI